MNTKNEPNQLFLFPNSDQEQEQVPAKSEEPPRCNAQPMLLLGAEREPSTEVAATALAGRSLNRETPRTGPCPDNDWLGIDDLESLKPLVLACSRCPLRDGAKGVVFGEGNPKARVMLIGEGPGQTEDETGRPFVGRAGQLLDVLLRSIGMKRQDVFIANIVKCRPPGNRIPLPEEVAACMPNLRAQIRMIKPEVIVLLGATASRNLVDDGIRVTRDRGRWIKKNGMTYLVTLHPAAVLRDEANKKPQVLADFHSLKDWLDRHVR